MSYRKFTEGITFYVSRQMRDILDSIAQDRRTSVSEFLREIIERHLSKEQKPAPQEQQDNFLTNLISNPKE